MKAITTNKEMDYSVNTLVEEYTNRQFALCESCFWSATIFNSRQKNVRTINYCPVCSNNNIFLIPLASDDAYDMNMRSKGGLELRFSKKLHYYQKQSFK
ncbi:MAG TPA: hypothetical protein VEL11_06005 [Candidatus Bathyarchaeia archaeon]|nr:hypothetical protein [Candidatus Bathyarchaeia archaeon]